MAIEKSDIAYQELNATPKINLDVDITIESNYQKIEKRYKCVCCGSSWDTQKNHFIKVPSKLFQSNNGYIDMCNDCRDKYFNTLVDLYDGNETLAIKHFCFQYDVAFNMKAVISSKRASKERSRISYYMTQRNLCNNEGSTYFDTIKNDFIDRKNNVIESIEDLKDETKEFKTDEKVVRFWGAGLEDSDYQFLQDEYNDWITRNECKTKAQEQVFKRICFIQLSIFKATLKGETTKDLDKTLQEYMDTAGIKPKQNNMDALSDAQTFGTLIQKWENERPLPEIDEELRDVDNIAKYIDVFYRGHLAKMMGLKNALSNIYTKFMKKYTVEKPEYDDDEDSEALFDAIFGDQSDD